MVAKKLINATNLHVGGGVQVAASVVAELARMKTLSGELDVFVSSEVERNVAGIVDSLNSGIRRAVMDVRGLDIANSAAAQSMDKYSTVFTIFGPLYRWRPPFRSIVGFAQPWIIYPENECYSRLPLGQKLKTKLKFKIQAMFFKRADALVVELEHVKKGLIRELGIAPERIHVVHNCLASIYLDEDAWLPIELPQVECDIRLGFVGKNYLHKNTAIFPQIVHILRERYGISARFFVTFSDADWSECSREFRDACINVGPLAAAQCPAFYDSIDAVVFPSLLECFSATPLEAMAMKKPLFASDRAFNRDVCGEHAHYFDPQDPEAAATRIATWFRGGEPDEIRLEAARDHAIGFASPTERAKQYLDLLDRC